MNRLIYVSLLTIISLSTMAITCDDARRKYSESDAAASGSGGGIASACTAPDIKIESLASSDMTLKDGLVQYAAAITLTTLSGRLDSVIKITDDSNIFADTVKKIEEEATASLPDIKEKVDKIFIPEVMQQPLTIDDLSDIDPDEYDKFDSILSDPKYLDALEKYIVNAVGYVDKYQKEPDKLKNIEHLVKAYLVASAGDYSVPMACKIVAISNKISSFPDDSWLTMANAWSGDSDAEGSIIQPLKITLEATLKDMLTKVDAAKKSGNDALAKKLDAEMQKYREVQNKQIEMLARAMETGCDAFFGNAAKMQLANQRVASENELLRMVDSK